MTSAPQVANHTLDLLDLLLFHVPVLLSPHLITKRDHLKMAATTDMEKQPLIEAQQPDQEEERSLAELQQDVFTAQRRYMRAWSKSTNGKWQKRIMLSVTGMLLFVMLLFALLIALDVALDDDEGYYYPGKVPLEAHIMSKCPDAKDCLHDLILPAMQNVSHKVDFRLSYIVSTDLPPQSFVETAQLTRHQGTTTHHDDGVLCKHGQEECLGNIIELCAQRHYPVVQSLGFTMCMTKEFEDIPKRELVEDCALEHGISMQKINDCATLEDGSVGTEMLQQSFNRSAEAGVSKSCTVRLNGKVRCVRDDGEWTDCEGGSQPVDLVRDVLEEYDARWEGY